MASPQILNKRFLIESKNVADTLQGHISIAKDLMTNKRVVIKTAIKALVYSNRSTKGHRVQENFLHERNILKTLTDLSNQTAAKPITGFAKFIDEWEDKKKYYYAMEFCQVDLFQYIERMFSQKTFTDPKSTKPQIPMSSPNPRVQNVTTIFAQLCNTVQWLHRNGFCHLDLSLENAMISDLETFKVKIIDFGVAKKFHHNNFLHEGRIGKVVYMAPEVYSKGNQTYDARAADVWCLGVMLFMMLIGSPPFQRGAGKHDDVFEIIFSGHRLRDLLAHWKRLHLVTEQVLDLLTKIFKYEKDRISLEDIIRHPFLAGNASIVEPKVEPTSNYISAIPEDEDEKVSIVDAVVQKYSRQKPQNSAQLMRFSKREPNNDQNAIKIPETTQVVNPCVAMRGFAAQQQNIYYFDNEDFALYSWLKPNPSSVHRTEFSLNCVVRDIRSNKWYTVRKVRNVFRDIAGAQSVYREMKLLSHLNHENVWSLCGVIPPTQYERDTFAHIYWIAPQMNTTLRFIIHSKLKLLEGRIQHFVYQIACGLQYIHSGGIAHRALTPQNILVDTESWTLKICDFRSSTALSVNNLLKYPIIPMEYASPEVMLSGLCMHQMDVWALGCIAAELFTGYPLFVGRNKHEQLPLILNVVSKPADLRWIKNANERQWIKRMPSKPCNFNNVVPESTATAQHFIRYLLSVNPYERPDINSVINHRWLKRFAAGKDYKKCPVFAIEKKGEQSIKTVFGVRHMMYSELHSIHKKCKKRMEIYHCIDEKKDCVDPYAAMSNSGNKDTKSQRKKQSERVIFMEENDEEIKTENIATDDHNRSTDIAKVQDVNDPSSPLSLSVSSGLLPASSRMKLVNDIGKLDDCTREKIINIFDKCKKNLNMENLHDLHPSLQNALYTVNVQTSQLIPILMFDHHANAYRYWLEYILTVLMNNGISIDVLLKYNAERDEVIVTSYFDKKMIDERRCAFEKLFTNYENGLREPSATPVQEISSVSPPPCSSESPSVNSVIKNRWSNAYEAESPSNKWSAIHEDYEDT